MNIKHVVLYADDDEDDRLLINDVFQNYKKIELITFSNGLELIGYLNNLTDTSNPCLIILDINMPILDGKETLVEIRKRKAYQSVPVIIFTTSNQRRDREFAFEYNASFITKPINLNQLENVATIFIDHCTEDVRNSLSSP